MTARPLRPVLPTEPTAPEPAADHPLDVAAEADRQLGVLLDVGYASLVGRPDGWLTHQVRQLGEALATAGPWMRTGSADRVPFVVVVSRRLVPADASMGLLELGGKPGFVSGDLADIGRFEPIEAVRVPDSDVYALLDVERGDEYLNRTPDEALPVIATRGRSPLTYDEGIALLAHAPHLLEPNRCFMLGASRCGDRRVPALWISGGTGKDGRERRGAPKLGWCWAGNRHTWLGHASCATRAAAPA